MALADEGRHLCCCGAESRKYARIVVNSQCIVCEEQNMRPTQVVTRDCRADTVSSWILNESIWPNPVISERYAKNRNTERGRRVEVHEEVVLWSMVCATMRRERTAASLTAALSSETRSRSGYLLVVVVAALDRVRRHTGKRQQNTVELARQETITKIKRQREGQRGSVCVCACVREREKASERVHEG
eukprot:COSAG05_NODE_2877_length_2551_cov_1.807504_1_plen_188_part_00